MFKDRYKRNNLITTKEQELLKNSKVLVFGLGGLGGFVVEDLVRIGVLNLVLVDGDVFSESNLNRQLFSLEKNIGKKKVECAKERIKEINSNVNVKTIDKFVTKKEMEEIIEEDVCCVIDCLDSIKSKCELEECCKNKNVKLVSGAIGGLIGHFTSIFPGDDTLKKYYKNKKELGNELGNLSFVASCIASFEVSECIKILLNKNDVMRNKMLYIDFEHNDFLEINVE